MLLALIAPALAADCAALAQVKVNEFVVTTGAEWIELHNASSGTVDLEGWTLEYGTSTWKYTVTLPSGASLPAGGFYVVGATGASTKDHDAGDLSDMGNAGSNADALRVSCDGAVADTVVYAASGKTNTDAWTDDTGGTASSLAPLHGSGQSTARIPDGADTDLSGDDFEKAPPTPGATNGEGGGDTGDTGEPVGDADCTVTDGVVINELDPVTTAEWLELYNGTGADVVVDGWTLHWGTSSYADDVTLAGTVPAGGFFLVGEQGDVTPDQVVSDLGLGNASTLADAVQLRCDGAAVDTVIYAKAGVTDADTWTDDNGELTTAYATINDSKSSMTRSPDGEDTDDCSVDFVLGDPTPGGTAPTCDTSGAGVVKVNEIFYNPTGNDPGLEWVELYNDGDATVSLDGWAIETATKDPWGEDYSFPAGTTLAAGAFLVVGGEDVDEADHVADSLSLGNGTEGDGVRLVDCDGGVVDTVLYGEAMASGLTDDEGGTTVVGEADEAQSLGRYPDGADGAGIDDWNVYSAPTPGEPNGGGGGDSGEPKTPPKCGERAETPERPAGSGCAALPLPLGGAELLVGLLALRRRRR